jgi:hypothetical protein
MINHQQSKKNRNRNQPIHRKSHGAYLKKNVLCATQCSHQNHLRKENGKRQYNETLLLIASEIIVVMFDFTILR